MFGLLNHQETKQLEHIAQLILHETNFPYLNESFIQHLPQMTSFPYQIGDISFEDLNGSLDEHLVPLSDNTLGLKIPQSVPKETKQLLIAKGIARWVLQLYQTHLSPEKSEDYLYGSDWTHKQNDEIHYLALCLLMPEPLFKTITEEVALSRPHQRVNLEALTTYFQLPEQAIIQRGVSLHLFTKNH